jgi:NADH-quinone oxidoreductase subunit N
MTLTDISWPALVPGLIVTVTAVIVLIADLFVEGPDREGLGWIGLVGLVAAGVASAVLWNSDAGGFGDTFRLDRYAIFFNLVLCLTGALTLLMSMDYLASIGLASGEYYVMLLLSVLGMMIMAQANDLILVFLGLELMSIAIYVLAGIWRPELRSSEAALKYFLLGAFASGFLLFGIAMAYGAFGTTTLSPIASQLAHLSVEQRPLALAATGLLLIGFGFKVAAAPFHSWAPDVYEGAPTSVTALMAVGVKTAAFAAFARVFIYALGALAVDWTWVIWLLAVLSMTIGNAAALLQRNIKRMLAYSSIAHAGYMLLGITSIMRDTHQGQAAVLFYLLTYTVSTAGAFGSLILCGSHGREAVSYDDLSGLGKRHPAAALAFSFFLLSLAGIPPTAGFFGKWFVFKATIDAGLYWLAIVALLNSAIAAYYYLRVLVYMYMREPAPGAPHAKPMRSGYVAGALVLAGIAVLALGVWPVTPLRVALEAALAAK